MRLPWLIAALILACVLAIVHFIALDRYLYWYYPELDIPMHLLAGLVMGTAATGVLGRERPVIFFITILTGTVGWEVFEFLAKISTGQSDYWSDTIQDICNGILGALVVYGIAHVTIWRRDSVLNHT